MRVLFLLVFRYKNRVRSIKPRTPMQPLFHFNQSEIDSISQINCKLILLQRSDMQVPLRTVLAFLHLTMLQQLVPGQSDG